MKFTVLKRSCLFLLIFCLLFAVGCKKRAQVEDQDVAKEALSGIEMPIELYVLDEVKAGKYEPASGIYTGAYVEKDRTIKGDILKYEELIGQKQTFKVFHYSRKEGISKQDILKCIAQRKIPYVKLLLDTDYDLTSLYQLIFDMKASYSTPIFIELYPLTEKAYAPDKYREIYQRAYEIIHKYLEDVVIVWSCDDTRTGDLSLFYPGEHYMDWVGINIYIPRFKNNKQYWYEGNQNLDYWYKTFQGKKPMMISGLAISHFSTVDHAYTIQETIATCKLFYEETLQAYPRIKGVIYMDVDMASLSNQGKENYEITGHAQLVEAMNDLSLPLIIHPQLVADTPSDLNCYQKYSIEALSVQGKIYIPQEYMSLCFSKVPIRKIRYVRDLSGEIYYAYEDIKSYCNSYYAS